MLDKFSRDLGLTLVAFLGPREITSLLSLCKQFGQIHLFALVSNLTWQGIELEDTKACVELTTFQQNIRVFCRHGMHVRRVKMIRSTSLQLTWDSAVQCSSIVSCSQLRQLYMTDYSDTLPYGLSMLHVPSHIEVLQMKPSVQSGFATYNRLYFLPRNLHTLKLPLNDGLSLKSLFVDSCQTDSKEPPWYKTHLLPLHLKGTRAYFEQMILPVLPLDLHVVELELSHFWAGACAKVFDDQVWPTTLQKLALTNLDIDDLHPRRLQLWMKRLALHHLPNLKLLRLHCPYTGVCRFDSVISRPIFPNQLEEIHIDFPYLRLCLFGLLQDSTSPLKTNIGDILPGALRVLDFGEHDVGFEYWTCVPNLERLYVGSNVKRLCAATFPKLQYIGRTKSSPGISVVARMQQIRIVVEIAQYPRIACEETIILTFKHKKRPRR